MSNIIKSGSRTPDSWNDFFNMNNLFDNMWPDRLGRGFPAVNISETEAGYTVEVAAPGFEKGDFKVKVDDDILTISAESKTENASNDKQRAYTRREYSYSSFTRSFRLPDNIKDDKISAGYKDGMLKLELPKSATQVKATKEITVN